MINSLSISFNSRFLREKKSKRNNLIYEIFYLHFSSIFLEGVESKYDEITCMENSEDCVLLSFDNQPKISLIPIIFLNIAVRT